MEKMPQTFSDAIVVCKALDIQCLWIDSLCIMQDSWRDWQRESAKMASYYGDCYFCIAATRGVDDHFGLLETSSAYEMPIKTPDGSSYNLFLRPSPATRRDSFYQIDGPSWGQEWIAVAFSRLGFSGIYALSADNSFH